MQRYFLSALLPLLFFGVVSAQPIDTARQIDQAFASWTDKTPGGAVLVARGKNIIYDKAFGLAEMEHQVPNRPTTIFECGSVSKQFTATAALLLVKEGKLSLEDDIRKYVPELPVYDAPIRIKHLLTHTSGLKDWGSIGAIAGWPRTTRVYTNALALQIICRQKSLNFKPGNEYSYSNSNYTLLVTLVERISKQSLADFTTERLFKPAGMKDTQWRDNFREIVPGRAVAYDKSGELYQQVMPFENVHGHGGLLTTTADLTKWNELLVTKAIGGDDVYGMRIKQGVLNNGTTISYASGLSVDKYDNLTMISHSGATAGYRAYLVSYPEKQLSIAILSNDGTFNTWAAANAIAKVFLPPKAATPTKAAPTGITLTPERIKQWTGIYKNIREFEVLTVRADGSQLMINDKKLTPIHADSLYDDDGTKWILKSPTKIMYIWESDTSSYVRVLPPDTSTRDLVSYEGVYSSAEVDCTVKVELKDNVLYWVNEPFPPIALQTKYLDGFQIDGWDLVEFQRDPRRGITGFTISTSRAEKMQFAKKMTH